MSNLMLLENPYNPWYEDRVKDTRFRYYSPKHSKAAKKGLRSKSMRNPVSASISKYTGGVDATDVIGGVLGLTAASMLPGLIVKTTVTSGQKFLKLLTAAGITVGLGFIAKKFAPQAAKGLVIGGLSGTAVQAVGMFTDVKIGALKAGAVNYPTLNFPNHPAANIGQTTKPEFQGIPNL